MHRIDGPGFGPGNSWTEGNPQSGTPATTITDDFQNDLQEEICTLIENAGLTLSKGTQDQLKDAITIMIESGGDPAAQIKFAIANAQGAATDVTGLVFDKTNFKAVKIEFELHRQTDSSDVQEMGAIYISHDTVADVWRISVSSVLDDAGVVFSVTSAGQIQYTSSNISGANYSGFIRVGRITKFNQ